MSLELFWNAGLHQDIPSIAFLCKSACKTQEVAVFAKFPEKSNGAQIRLTWQWTNFANYRMIGSKIQRGFTEFILKLVEMYLHNL